MTPQPSVRVLQAPAAISVNPQYYHGWPTLTKLKDGRLMLVYSGGRQAHVCPFGRVELMISDDGGESWSWPRVIADGTIDDRDAGITELPNGVLVVAYFTSLAYKSVTSEQLREEFLLEPEEIALWPHVAGHLPEDAQEREVGDWITKSLDGGLTWSPRLRTPVNCPHGPIGLSDGRLLYAGKENTSDGDISVWQSCDEGESWEKLGNVPSADGHDGRLYYELHTVETKTGRLIAHIRSHAHPLAGNATPDWIETLQTESLDGGRSWSKPHSVGYYGYPSHLLRLGNGDLLVTYGHRIAPFGIQARLSRDDGATWSAAHKLTEDGASLDLGYPSTVERADGTLVTVWYERLRTSPKAVLRQMIWALRCVP
jgi:sialidase-1